MRNLLIAPLLAAALCSCATTPALFQRGTVNVVVGDAARRQGEMLATARGGTAEGIRSEQLETVALFDSKAMPTGVTVSPSGRIFLSFPRWGDKVDHTVMELRAGRLAPYPDAEVTRFVPNVPEKFDPRSRLVSVQSVFADSRNRLWLLDPGSINLGPVIDGAPKLWAYDLGSGTRVKEITFPNDVVFKRSYLNDLRIDLARGQEGIAYITDSGVGGIIVVNLASGNSWRHLDNHPSVKPAIGIQQISEGRPFLQRKPTREVASPDIRSDGIALCPDGKELYYSPLAGRTIYSVPTDLLATRHSDPKDVAASVRLIASKPSGNDGLICDSNGQLYSTDFEDQAIRKIDPATGRMQIVVQDERLLWPDTFALHGDELYVTNNQLARQPSFNFGQDMREPPYALFRVNIG